MQSAADLNLVNNLLENPAEEYGNDVSVLLFIFKFTLLIMYINMCVYMFFRIKLK